jgi:competence protein ComEA
MNQVWQYARHLAGRVSLFTVLVAFAAVPAFAVAQALPPGANQAGGAVKEKPAAAPVNINTATATELEKLPGVGPATAARMIEYRQKNGGFKKVEDVMNIRGIGEKSFLKLKPLITIAPPKAFGL